MQGELVIAGVHATPYALNVSTGQGASPCRNRWTPSEIADERLWFYVGAECLEWVSGWLSDKF